MNRYETGTSDTRPWGTWLVIDQGENYTVKRIKVNPKARLSLQKHRHRLERWTIVEGKGEVTLDESVIKVNKHDAVFIPLGAIHRISNTGETDLVFIEVQMGEQLDENDIIRIEDDYGRN